MAVLAVFCAGVAAGADRKQVESLIQQVRDVTGAEPALLSVDTQIRLAAATAKLHPKKALEAARDAGSLLLTLGDPETRGQLGVRLTEVLRQIDPEEARRYVLSMERRTVSGAYRDGVYRDTKAEALDFVVRYWIPRDRKRAVEVLSEAIGAGAFRAESVQELMDLLGAEEPAAVPGLFAVLLAAFPEEGATDRDCLLLLRRAAHVAPAASALAVEAARKILRALDSKRFQEDPEWRVAGQYSVGGSTVKAESARDAIRLEVAGLLATFSPETYNQYAERFGLDLAAAQSITAASDLKLSLRNPGDREDSPLAAVMMRGRPALPPAELVQPSYTEPVEAAVERARLDDAGSSRALTLVEIAMRRDATPAQRAQISGEAIDAAEKDPLLYSRLWVYEGLLPYLWQHGNFALAIKAGQAMARTVARFCKCEDRACGSLKERAECLTANQRVAEDLFNFEIAPEDLGIGDPSLRARSLLLKLREMALPVAAK
ncbi:MAG TPA: hypothetical protein VNY05_21245 [Candidatus Acidoferrales bacterium]|nr:hypothetical protein [Candidatus Acidoferrales bacterium]